MRLGLAVLCLLTAGGCCPLAAQTLRYTRTPDAHNGKILYKSGCIACHGVNGNGAPQTSTEFKRPDTFPDFTRCDQTTPEPNDAWKSIIVHGGPSRGLSTIMPAFDKLLTNDQIDDLVAYLRTFCTETKWPRGELNLPRALVTEKAFPEDEFVLSTAANASGAPGLKTDFIHEQSFGAKSQLEVDVPWDYQDQNHNWNSHVGDITLGWKQVMFSSLRTGSILSLQGGILPPTGSQKLGGNGTTVFEPFAAFDQLFRPTPGCSSRWAPTSRVTPTSRRRASSGTPPSARPSQPDHRLGRQWSPMVEFLATRDLVRRGQD